MAALIEKLVASRHVVSRIKNNGIQSAMSRKVHAFGDVDDRRNKTFQGVEIRKNQLQKEGTTLRRTTR